MKHYLNRLYKNPHEFFGVRFFCHLESLAISLFMANAFIQMAWLFLRWAQNTNWTKITNYFLPLFALQFYRLLSVQLHYYWLWQMSGSRSWSKFISSFLAISQIGPIHWRKRKSEMVINGRKKSVGYI